MRSTRAVMFSLVAGLFGVALSGVSAGQALPSTPPAAPVRPVTDALHGVAVTDPYRWMEDGGQEFTDWLKAQDGYTRAVLERIPGRRVSANQRQVAFIVDASVDQRSRRSRTCCAKKARNPRSCLINTEAA